MNLSELLAGSGDAGGNDPTIAGITADSRAVRPGFAFFAVPGTKSDGLAYAPQAVAAGAVAVIAEQPRPVDFGDTAFVQVKTVRRALSLAASRVHPRQPAMIAAITGTSGKTSVAAFLRQIWATLGERAASVGTVGLVTPDREIYGSLTTPDPVDLHRTLDALAGEGITHLALEASSHGLDQHRLDGVRVAAGGFTNLSRDHLDYHPSVEAYLAAKLRLFSDLIVEGGTAVVAADHVASRTVIDVAAQRGLRVMTVGRAGETVRLADVQQDGFVQVLRLTYKSQTHRVRLPLVGAFQIENALVAAGLAIATGGASGQVFAALETLKGAKGRLDLVGTRHGAPVFVDYAHKPDALEKALAALRPAAAKNLVVVFGCGGDRDRGKRPIMGEIAASGADRVIVTDDNPRSEDPAAIRRAILDAAPEAIEIADRGEAIATAIRGLETGDVLLVAGKGHETGQIVGDRTLPFSDHEAVAAALAQGD